MGRLTPPISERRDQIASRNLLPAPIKQCFGLAPADEAAQAFATSMDPLAEFVCRQIVPPRLVQARQGGLEDCPGVVVEADQGIELCLAGRGIADCPGYFAGKADQVRLKPGIALFLGPDRAAGDSRAGCPPTDGPRIAAGSRIRIGFEQPVFSSAFATLETFDQGEPGGADPRRTVETVGQR